MSEFNQNLAHHDILLVEDDEDLREMVMGLLSRWGYKVKVAKNYQEAIENLTSFRFSLLISDINLPDKSGVDILKWVKQNAPMCRVILMTGYLEETDIHDALDLGVFGFIAKPISRKELQKIVKNALGTNSEDKITDIDFARVDIDDFLTGKVLNFPVYVRLKDNRFLKVAHSGTEIDLSRLELLKSKDIHELWIDKEDLPAYLQLNKRILNAKSNWSTASKVRFLNHMVEVTHESMRLMNLSSESIRFSLDALATFTKHMAKVNGTMPFVNPFIDNHTRGSKLAVLGVSYSLALAKVLDWTSEKTSMALAFGAFFRDLSLTQENFDFDSLSKDGSTLNREDYREHPLKSAEILRELKHFPNDALTIIEQHHEDGSEKAFPFTLGRNKIFQPALLLAHIENMLELMLLAGNRQGDDLREFVLDKLKSSISPQDQVGVALLVFLKTGDITAATKEMERLKKIS